MSIQKNKPEQFVTVLRQIEVQMANGKTVPQRLQGSRNSHPDVLSVAEGVRRTKIRAGQTAEGIGEGECTTDGWWQSCRWRSRSAGGGSGKLLSPERRCCAVERAEQGYGMSERHACGCWGNGEERNDPCIGWTRMN